MSNILDILGNIVASIIFAMPALPLAVAAAVAYMLVKGRAAKKLYAFGLAVFVLYIYIMLDITLISRVMALLRNPGEPVAHTISPIPFDGIVNMATAQYDGVNYNVFARNVFGNIIMFIPLGALLPMMFPKLRHFGRVALVAVALSFSIEFIQYWIGGVSDIDDLMLNTLGACLGYAVYAMGIKLYAHIGSARPYSEENEYTQNIIMWQCGQIKKPGTR